MLLVPAFARSGWLPATLLDQGPFGMELLNPLALFGLAGLDQITHAMVWSMIANVGLYVGVSLASTQSAVEHHQASMFVDVFNRESGGARFWRGTANVADLHGVLARFLGASAADAALADYARRYGVQRSDGQLVADADLVHHVERQLAGAIGAASARIMIASAVKEEALTIEEVRAILNEASQVIVYSHRLEQKSRELEAATAELRQANERLQELDRMKDDFMSTVTHELRTPLTSIRAFSEILQADPRVALEERKKFLALITRETGRLTRLINQVLDVAKIESGRLIQVLVNLLSNALKFVTPGEGRVVVRLSEAGGKVRLDVRDNGPGIRLEEQAHIFDKFRQAGDMLTAKPPGTGLGLHISRQIVEHLGGRIWVDSRPGEGACFSFELPVAREPAQPQAA